MNENDTAKKPLYLPGEEPDDTKEKLHALFEKLDNAYPNKQIASLAAEHPKWAETVTMLYHKLGYATNESFLNAYGYTVTKQKSGRKSTIKPSEIIEELKHRYPNGSPFSSVSDLFAANPDFSKNQKTLINTSTEYFGMPLGKYLKSIGLLTVHQSAKPTNAEKTLVKQPNNFKKTVTTQKTSDSDTRLASRGYIIENNVLYEKDYTEICANRRNEYEKNLNEFLEQVRQDLHQVTNDLLPKNITELATRFPKLPIFEAVHWIFELHAQNPEAFLLEQGILQKPHIEIDNNIKKLTGKCKRKYSSKQIFHLRNSDYLLDDTINSLFRELHNSGIEPLRYMRTNNILKTPKEISKNNFNMLKRELLFVGEYSSTRQTANDEMDYYSMSDDGQEFYYSIYIYNVAPDFVERLSQNTSGLELSPSHDFTLHKPVLTLRTKDGLYIGSSTLNRVSAIATLLQNELAEIKDITVTNIVTDKDELFGYSNGSFVLGFTLILPCINPNEVPPDELYDAEEYVPDYPSCSDEYRTECYPDKVYPDTFHMVTSFGKCVFRGVESEIEKALDFLSHHKYLVSKQSTKEKGIYEFEIISGPAGYTDELLKNFPSLKMVGFYADWTKQQIFAAYSPSGYTGIEEFCFVDYIYKNTSMLWFNEFSPAKRWSEKVLYETIGENVYICYTYPHQTAMDEISYVIEYQGKTYRITSVRNKEEELLQLASAENHITKYAFLNSDIKAYAIPDGITSIGKGAFKNCKKLKSIHIPSSVIEIKEEAFENCESLEEITLPEGITRISPNTFANCKRLRKVHFPNSLRFIDFSGFYQCSALEEIIFPENLKVIEAFAFSRCSSLATIQLPDTLLAIEHHAFSSCSKFTAVTFPKSLIHLGYDSFIGCFSLKNVQLPNNPGIDWAFNDCPNLLISLDCKLTRWTKFYANIVVTGFSNDLCQKKIIDSKLLEQNLIYLRQQRKRYEELAIYNEAVLRVMLGNRIFDKDVACKLLEKVSSSITFKKLLEDYIFINYNQSPTDVISELKQKEEAARLRKEKIEQNLKDEYIYCRVIFKWGNNSYYYITEDDNLKFRDYVVVPVGEEGKTAVAMIIEMARYSKNNVPRPVSETKCIIRKCTEDDMKDW